MFGFFTHLNSIDLASDLSPFRSLTMGFLCFSSSVNKDLDRGPLDDSLTDIQWLSRISMCALEPDPAEEENTKKENQNPSSQVSRLWLLHVWREP